jgi:hypothetical protein
MTDENVQELFRASDESLARLTQATEHFAEIAGPQFVRSIPLLREGLRIHIELPADPAEAGRTLRELSRLGFTLDYPPGA